MPTNNTLNPTQAATTFFQNYENFKYIFDSFFDKVAKHIAKENDKDIRDDLVHQLRVVNKTWEMLFNDHEEEVKRAIADKTPDELQQILVAVYNEAQKAEIFN